MMAIPGQIAQHFTDRDSSAAHARFAEPNRGLDADAL
jgi:hypothetical protein